ncbi:MAG: glycosyltransferase [Muribaculaceae bacterium]|nr:glycosyltransferase [Muribaculaceae bacterium]
MVKVSIIIPVYNVEPYLQQCLDSMHAQQDPSFEVILVDDGSTDNSGKICDLFAETHNNTTVIHQENGGLSDARNAGIKIAQGEYIYFLDSDDWLAPNAISSLLDFAIDNNCDIVQGGFFYAYSDRLTYNNTITTPLTLSREQAMEALIKNDFLKNFAWGKLFKASIIKNAPFKKGVFFEDSYWKHLVIDQAPTYGIIPTPFYYYRQRNDSISGTLSPKIIDLLKGYEDRILFIGNNYPNLLGLMVKQYWNLCSNMLHTAKSNPNNHKEILQYWQTASNSHKPLFDKYMSNSLRYKLMSHSCAYSIFNIFDRLINRFRKQHFITVHYENSPIQ